MRDENVTFESKTPQKTGVNLTKVPVLERRDWRSYW